MLKELMSKEVFTFGKQKFKGHVWLKEPKKSAETWQKSISVRDRIFFNNLSNKRETTIKRNEI